MSIFREVKATVYVCGEFMDNFSPPKEFQGQWSQQQGCINCPFYDSIYSERVEICKLLHNNDGLCPIYNNWIDNCGGD